MKEHGDRKKEKTRPPPVGHIPSDILLQDRHLQHLVSSSIPSPPFSGMTLFSPAALFGGDPRAMLSAHFLASIQMASNPDVRFQIPLSMPLTVQTSPSQLFHNSIVVMNSKNEKQDNDVDLGIRSEIITSSKTVEKEHILDVRQPVNNNNIIIENIQQQQQSNQQSRDKVFICPICSRCFGYKHVLQNHERTHTGEKPFECNICQKKFTRDHHLKTHKRLHTGEKPYQCTHCDRLFVQVANLRRHLRVHTGERPYACHLCQSRFSDSNQLKAHMLIHKGEKPYTCPGCDGRFRRRHHLLHHKCNKEASTPESLPRSPPEDISPPSGCKRERKSRETRRIIRHGSRPDSTVSTKSLGFGQIIPEQTHPEDLSLSNVKIRHFSGSHSSCSASPSPPSGGSQGSIGIYCRSITSSDPAEYSSDEDRSVTASSSNNGKTESDEASPHV